MLTGILSLNTVILLEANGIGETAVDGILEVNEVVSEELFVI